MRRIGQELLREKKINIDENANAEKEQGRGSGKDLLSVLVRANMDTELPESQRMSDEDVLRVWIDRAARFTGTTGAWSGTHIAFVQLGKTGVWPIVRLYFHFSLECLLIAFYTQLSAVFVTFLTYAPLHCVRRKPNIFVAPSQGVL